MGGSLHPTGGVGFDAPGEPPAIEAALWSDLRQSARRLAWAKFTNAGRTCVAPDYVMTTPDRIPALVDALGDAIADMWGSEPRASRDYGRIVGLRQFDRLVGLLNSDELVIDGEQDRSARYIAPTAMVISPTDARSVLRATATHPAWREEMFGPVLLIVPAASAKQTEPVLDEAWLSSSSDGSPSHFER